MPATWQVHWPQLCPQVLGAEAGMGWGTHWDLQLDLPAIHQFTLPTHL